MSLSIIHFPAYVSCACCGYAMAAEQIVEMSAREVVIACGQRRCEQYGKRVILRATIIDCEDAA